MLKVTLHAAKPQAVNERNVLGRLDIAYEKLDAIADYKAVMFTSGIGAQAPVALKAYPRWSASLWDLVVRMACLSINKTEAVSTANIPVKRTGAFIENMTAVVEHWADGLDTRRSVVGTAHVAMGANRCNYRATFVDDIAGSQGSEVFRHTPEVLTPWDLLTRAYAWATTASLALPARPTLYTPIPISHEGQSFVSLDTVSEPARTGFYRWLDKRNIKTVTLGVPERLIANQSVGRSFLRGLNLQKVTQVSAVWTVARADVICDPAEGTEDGVRAKALPLIQVERSAIHRLGPHLMKSVEDNLIHDT